MTDRTRSAASRARNTPALRIATRAGYASNGVVNLLIGLLALGVVGTGASGGASPDGALTGIAQAPGGQVLIWVLVVGLAALGVWQLVSAVLERDDDPKRLWAARAKAVGKGVAYLALGGIGIRVALGGSGGGSAEQDLTAQLLATPGGVVLVVLLGLATIAVGGYLVVKGARRKFLDDLTAPSGTVGTAVTVVGVVGYIARGVAFGVIGVLFIVAAFTADAAEAGGLDAALASLSALPFGQVLLVGVALGFVAFGLYSFARARYAKL